MRQIIIFFLLSVAFLNTLPINSFAKEKLIAVTEEWPPFRIYDSTAKNGFSGIDIDLLKSLEQYLDCEIEVRRYPFARAVEMIRMGQADIIPGIAFTEKRAEFVDYVEKPYYSVGPVFYTQKGNGHNIKTYQDLYKYKIGYSLNSAYFEPFNSDSKLNKVGISTEKQLIKMAALGRVDITIGTNPNFAYDIKRYQLNNKLEQTQYIPEQVTPLYMGLSKQSEKKYKLKKKIHTYLETILNDGTMDKIVNRYR